MAKDNADVRKDGDFNNREDDGSLKPFHQSVLRSVSGRRHASASPARRSSSVDAAKEQNEESPLLAAEDDSGDNSVPSPVTQLSDDDGDWIAETGEETKSSLYLFLLTLTVGGLQLSWSVELSNGSPFLLSLGLSKSLLALVWIAGPLSGTLVQPYVGIKSDRCRLRWGKRRPFMVGGAVATVLSILALAWTREIIEGTLGIFGASPEDKGVKVTAIVWAVLFVYILDFSINTIQAAIRAFIVDCAPTHQQDDANAWAVKLTGIGSILTFLTGYLQLPRVFPWLGNSQFKVLCSIAVIGLVLTMTISCLAIQERDPRLEGEPPPEEGGVFAFFVQLYHSVRRLPKQIRRVCQVQFFAWIGWFPFLFYITTYVGEIYAEPIFRQNPHMTPEEIDAVWEDATRVGTVALFIEAIVTFVASIVLPFLITPYFEAPPVSEPAHTISSTHHLSPQRSRASSSYVPVGSGASGGAVAASTTSSSARATHKGAASPNHLASAWRYVTAIDLRIPGLTLRKLWLLSHLLFALLMASTFVVRDTTPATVLVALVGIPWAITNWAPFALISQEISMRDAIRRGVLPPSTSNALHGDPERPASGSRTDLESASLASQPDAEDQAGVVLGIHNVAIAAPQVVATLVGSAIFRALQKPRGTPGDESVAWVLRFGGLCALAAAWLTTRVGEGRRVTARG